MNAHRQFDQQMQLAPNTPPIVLTPICDDGGGPGWLVEIVGLPHIVVDNLEWPTLRCELERVLGRRISREDHLRILWKSTLQRAREARGD